MSHTGTLKVATTPGPWKAIPGNKFIWIGQMDRKLIVAGLHRDLRENPHDIEADARLIAAAPELLEALRQLVNMTSQFAEDYEPDEAVPKAFDKARAAIKKATDQ